MEKDSKDEQHVHSQIAQMIEDAARALFTRHQEGMDLHRAADLFVADISRRFQNELPLEHVPTTGLREHLADAIAEIITNDAAPPRLCDRVVDYVTDAPSYSPLYSEAASRETKEENRGADSGVRDFDLLREKIRQCERLARQCVAEGQDEQQLALVTLLHTIARGDRDASDLTMKSSQQRITC